MIIHVSRAVIKGRRPGIFPGKYECNPAYLSSKKEEKAKQYH